MMHMSGTRSDQAIRQRTNSRTHIGLNNSENESNLDEQTSEPVETHPEKVTN